MDVMASQVNESNIELLGSLSCPVDFCISILEGDNSTIQKKEAMSSIGRQRDSKYKPILFQYAEHKNPEIAMQAIRGLLVFRNDEDVVLLLKKLADHSNDMIKDMVALGLSKSDETENKDQVNCPDFLKNVVVQGDVLETIKHVADESIHLTFTSPPYYNARDYSIYANYKEYLDFLETVFKEVLRITKEGRFFVLNTSPIIIPRAGRKYSSRRYPLPFDINTRMMNIGWEFIDDIVWAKPEKSAKNRVSNFNVNRKPLTYKPNPCSEYLMVYRKKTHRLIDWNLKQYDEKTINDSLVDDDFERSNIWSIPPVSNKIHSAVFPMDLCNQVIKLYSFKNDLVFDPFGGSGTTGLAAMQLDRNFFLTELSEKYVDTIEKRIGYSLLTQDYFTRYKLDEFIYVADNDHS